MTKRRIYLGEYSDQNTEPKGLAASGVSENGEIIEIREPGREASRLRPRPLDRGRSAGKLALLKSSTTENDHGDREFQCPGGRQGGLR